MGRKPRLRNLLVHKVPGTGKEEDEYNYCDKVAGSRSQDHGKDCKEQNQDQEGCETDDHIKKSFIHYRKFLLSEDIGLSELLHSKNLFHDREATPGANMSSVWEQSASLWDGSGSYGSVGCFTGRQYVTISTRGCISMRG